MTRKAIDRLDTVALLAALALFLSSIEFLIPKPLPFLRIGIANLALLVGIRLLTVRSLLLLVALKVLVQGILFGTIFSYVFLLSALGSLTSALVMISVDRLFGKRVSLVGVSVLGAFSSNVVQLLCAGFIFLGWGVLIVAPPFLVVGTVSAIALGLASERFMAKSLWVARQKIKLR